MNVVGTSKICMSHYATLSRSYVTLEATKGGWCAHARLRKINEKGKGKGNRGKGGTHPFVFLSEC